MGIVRTGRWIGLVATTVLAAACGMSAGSDLGGGAASGFGGGAGAGSGDFGATQGGVQDMGAARELVAEGVVPPPEALLVEAMFSEHDLPVEGAPCETLLCLRGAAGVAPTTEGEKAAWLQVGMSSTIDPETYERPSLTVIATVDVSGSMQWNNGTDQPTPGEVARTLLGEIADRLGPDDRIAIVTYGSTVNTVLRLSAGHDGDVDRAIARLGRGGSTNMEAGLREAFRIGQLARDGETDEVRVMLFTDIQPNVGATGESEFERMVGNAAEHGIGTTLYALGVGLSPEHMRAMSHLRGGNAFSLHTFEDVPELMRDSWPWMVSPIAYDLDVHIQPRSGFELVEGYGFPETTAEGASLDVSTVFLSRRKGALLLRFAPVAGADPTTFGVAGSLSYERLDGERIHQELGVDLEGIEIDDRGQAWQQHGVQKTAALAQLVRGMRRAAEQYGTDADDAVNVLDASLERFTEDAESLDDPDLEREIDFARDLVDLMASGARQGTLYGR